jgi:hypothetical protein
VGVTDSEMLRRYPCDEFVVSPELRAWRGVGIDAPANVVSPWVAQVRLAPYSYDWIDNLGRRSPRVLVGFPEPQVGERFTTAGGRELGRIVSVDLGKQLTGTVLGTVMTYVPSETAASPRPQYVTCIHDGCDRITDSLRRLPLSQAEQTAAEATLHRVIADLPHGELQSSCGPPSQPISDRRESTRTGRCSSTYSPPTIDQVRRALVEAGYRDVVVRQPRADDPAPPGTVLIAVSVGPACVLAYTDGHSTPAEVRGRLPNGRCVKD